LFSYGNYQKGRKNVKEQWHSGAELTRNILASQKTCGSKELLGSLQGFWSGTSCYTIPQLPALIFSMQVKNNRLKIQQILFFF